MGEGTVIGFSETVEQGSARRLMVVDSAAETRQAVAEYFRARGYEVGVASGGVEALALIFKERVDVVIMNAVLGDLEGYETAAIIRRISPRVRVVLTMETAAEAPSRERLRTERFRCFPKPLDLEAVASAIEGPEASRVADTTSEVED